MSHKPDLSADGSQSQIDYRKELNPSQLEAVLYHQGPLLVIAGAGSGKTRTLTYRVARLVENGVPASKILLLTFTRKASSEMLNRAALLLDNRCKKVSGGTFHSFAYSLLRQNAAKAGFANGFSVIDRADAEALMGMIRGEVTAKDNLKSFPKKQTLLNIFSQAINKSLTPEDIVYDGYPHFQPYLIPILEIFELYQQRKQYHGFVDYDDLLVLAQRLLADFEDVRQRAATAYDYIMVDEYQDTNRLQAELLYLLSNQQQNVMAVGDDSQSIYAFRGADFRNIIEFPQRYPNTKIINLEENYRSRQPILNLTNTMIAQAVVRYEKRLYSRQPGGSKPILVNTGSEHNQSRYVVEKIMALHRHQIPLREIAVLFRASFHSFDLELELNRSQIPFVKVGGFKFIESAHIKDVLAHLRVLVHPNDRLSWYRLLLLLDGIGPKSAVTIYEAIVDRQAGYNGIQDVACLPKQAPQFDRLKALFFECNTGQMSILQMGEAVVRYYEPILKERFDDYPKRIKDLEHLLSIMERYDNLAEFLTDMALEPPTTIVDNRLANPAPTDERLTLSTIHSAKGLEWHTVFIIWGLDGRFPSVHALDNPDEIEEELRLMYVAATRAKQNLFITYPNQVYDRSSGMLLSRPSRFVAAVTEDVLERHYMEKW